MTGQQTDWYVYTNTDLLLVAGCKEEQLVHVCMGVDRIFVCNTHFYVCHQAPNPRQLVSEAINSTLHIHRPHRQARLETNKIKPEMIQLWLQDSVSFCYDLPCHSN